MQLPVGHQFKGAKQDDWTITGPAIVGTCCDVYPAHSDRADLDVMVKVPRHPGNIDLLEREQSALGVLRREDDTPPGEIPSIPAIERAKFKWFVPNLVDTGYLYDGADILTVNIIEKLNGFYTLAEVRDAFPGGVDPQDAAWMWRRLLMAVGFAHRQGVIHGAVFPENVMIHPAKHGLTLIDWCYSVPDDQRMNAMIGKYLGWYPHEVEAKLNVDFSLDIVLATKTMLWLMGDKTPAKLRGFGQACTTRSRSTRPHDAWRLRGTYDELIERMWGPRKFREFKFP